MKHCEKCSKYELPIQVCVCECHKINEATAFSQAERDAEERFVADEVRDYPEPKG